MPTSKQSTPELPFFNIHASTQIAAGIAGTASWFVGLFALMAVQRARVIIQQITSRGPAPRR
jgi:hypothetical protein